MPNLASVKEEPQVSPFLKDGVFHSDSQQPISIQGAPAGREEKESLWRPSGTWSGNLVGGKMGWSWEEKFYLQGLTGSLVFKNPQV